MCVCVRAFVCVDKRAGGRSETTKHAFKLLSSIFPGKRGGGRAAGAALVIQTYMWREASHLSAQLGTDANTNKCIIITAESHEDSRVF